MGTEPVSTRSVPHLGTLVAVLANPVPGPSSRSERQVAVAARVLGFQNPRIVNLFAIASVSSRDIAHLGAEPTGWIRARETLEQSLEGVDGVLVAFGNIPARGQSRTHLREQLRWLSLRLQASQHIQVWQVGTARHPSRWHQYVSDVHGRTSGGDFETRLAEVLRPVPLDERMWTM